MSEKKYSRGMLPLIIVEILRKYTDPDHHMFQQDMLDVLLEDYGITLDRKAIPRNLKKLRDEMGMDIVITDKQGFWLNSREFKEHELRLLIDSVASNKYISQSDSDVLIKKIASLESENFKSHLKNVYVNESLGKTTNSEVYTNIEKINEAINTCSMIKYTFETDCELTRESHIAKSVPTCILFVSQRYFLRDDKMRYIPLDRISNLEILYEDKFEKKPIGNEEKRYLNSKTSTEKIPLPDYEEEIYVTFNTGIEIIEELRDTFGYGKNDVVIRKRKGYDVLADSKLAVCGLGYEAVVKTTRAIMLRFMCEKMAFIEIVAPTDMRERFIQFWKTAGTIYGLYEV